MIRDYYTVSVPGDAFDNKESLISHAIDEARERARLWCVPAEWTGRIISGEVGDWEVTVRVRRRRNKVRKIRGGS